MGSLNPRIALLGLATIGAVVALIVVAMGGDEPSTRKTVRAPRAEASATRDPEPEPEPEAARPERPQPALERSPSPNPVAPNVVRPPARKVAMFAPGSEPRAIAELNQAYEAWMKTEENRFAKPESYGLDCRPPVCMLGAKYDSLEDGRFFDRSEIFFRERGELGHLISFPHRMDERHSRAWFFYNPYEPGTPEHHEFNVSAIERIKEELKEIPEYYPVPRPGY